MPHYDDLNQLSSFNFMDKAAKEDDEPSQMTDATENVLDQSVVVAQEWLRLGGMAFEPDRSARVTATEILKLQNHAMADCRVLQERLREKGVRIAFDEPDSTTIVSGGEVLAENKAGSIDRTVAPPVLTEYGPMELSKPVVFAVEMFSAETSDQMRDGLERSRPMCRSALLGRGVRADTITEEIQWHTGHQKWELTLWGSSAD